MNNDNLELASTRSRLLAFVIDDFLITFIIILIYWDTITAVGNDMESILTSMNNFLMPILFVKFIYQTLFVWYYGATVGKIITKIRVIDYDDLNNVSIFKAALRSFVRLLSEMFFYIGFLLYFFTEGKQTLHDKIGRTLVINV